MLDKTNIIGQNPAGSNDALAGLFNILSVYLNNYVDTVQPVEVSKVNGGLVDVKPVLKNMTTSGKVLDITENDVIPNVPIIIFGGNGASFTFDLAQGDKGLLIACKHDISNFKKNKTADVIASKRTFSWTDGFFLPLIFATPEQGIILKKGNSTIKIQESQIDIETSTVNIQADNVTIDAQTVNLAGDGGKGVAREGDEVEVQVTSGSSAGTWKGTITKASEKVKAN